MKKIILTIAFTFISIVTFSQTKVGLQFNYGTETEFGIGVNAAFNVTDEIAISPSINYFVGKSITGTGFFVKNVSTSFIDINADGHYNFKIQEGFSVYPLVGLNIAMGTISYGVFGNSKTFFGANLGGGLNYNFSKKISGVFETKYVAREVGQAVFTLGAFYNF